MKNIFIITDYSYLYLALLTPLIRLSPVNVEILSNQNVASLVYITSQMKALIYRCVYLSGDKMLGKTS